MSTDRSVVNAGESRPRNPESGYALLLVFAMAAIVAVTLYMEVPRTAFEAQRDKEQLLQDRGQEYSRAIALYVHKFNRFPSSMEDLENTNNQRFLRRRFVDPMTGKADWRILHAGPGGVITDSVLNVKKADGDTWSTNMITLGPMTGTAPTGSDSSGANLATRVRPSDQTGGVAGNADPGSSSGNSGAGGYNGPVMVLPDGRIVPANASGAPATPAQGGNPGTPGMPGAPGSFGMGGAPVVPNGTLAPNGTQVPNGAQLPTGVAIQQNAQPGQNTPALPSQYGPPSGAANLINQILTSPRPGGLNGGQGGQGSAAGAPLTGGATPAGSTTSPQQQVIGAGLAGVASKREAEGIKTYNERTKYNEWEFVYDVTKDPTKVGAGAASANAAAAAAAAAASASGATSAAQGSGSTSAPTATGSMSSGTMTGH